ncbi:MAG TPA: purine-nucleoside phosphorylase [Terriglobales bacterium]|nr:purine-nucleoside phosphorylase [Terriglobales bacterium]
MEEPVAGSEFERAKQAAAAVRARTRLHPQVALVLGSGLGAFADTLAGAVRIPYHEIPHFPRPTAEGHAGNLVLGRVGTAVVAAMQGRVHYYEGRPLREVVFPIRVLGYLGVGAAILTSAAGGIHPSYGQGGLVVLRDHINLQGSNPLIGPNEEKLGPRFVDMTEAYDRRYREIALEEGQRLDIAMHEGVYAAVSGPSYETPAEIGFLRAIGADLVGMSTVPEVIAARHMGIRCLAISCVTNLAAGITGAPLSHQEVIETGERVRGKFAALLEAVIPRIAEDSKPPARR